MIKDRKVSSTKSKLLSIGLFTFMTVYLIASLAYTNKELKIPFLAYLGHPDSMYMLAQGYLVGQFKEDADAPIKFCSIEDYNCKHHSWKQARRSLKWYKRAATEGNPLAQYRLGKLYLHGMSVYGVRVIDKNWDKASEYLHEADKNGYPGAKRLLESYAEELSSYERFAKQTRYALSDRTSVVNQDQTGTENLPIIEIQRTIHLIVSLQNAFKSFKSRFGVLPGDANGDGFIGGLNSYKNKVQAFEDERHLFWVHLSKESLIDEFQFDKRSSILKWGEALPSAPIGGGFQVVYNGSAKLPRNTYEQTPKAAHYMILTNDLSGNMSDKNTDFISPSEAYMIDSVLDDGDPARGRVLASSSEPCLYLDEDDLALANIWKYTDSIEPCISLYIQLPN
jgi:hypothetical protein